MTIEAASKLAFAVYPDLAGKALRIEPRDEVLGPMAGAFWRGHQSPGVVRLMVDTTLPAGELEAVVLHELSHWLTADEQSPAPSIAFYQAAAATIEDQTQAASDPTMVPAALWSHDISFIRAAAHLWCRAVYRADCYLPLPWLAFANCYPTLESISDPGAYVAALMPELKSESTNPIRDILATDAPAEFAALWDRDLQTILSIAQEARK